MEQKLILMQYVVDHNLHYVTMHTHAAVNDLVGTLTYIAIILCRLY